MGVLLHCPPTLPGQEVVLNGCSMLLLLLYGCTYLAQEKRSLGSPHPGVENTSDRNQNDRTCPGQPADIDGSTLVGLQVEGQQALQVLGLGVATQGQRAHSHGIGDVQGCFHRMNLEIQSSSSEHA